MNGREEPVTCFSCAFVQKDIAGKFLRLKKCLNPTNLKRKMLCLMKIFNEKLNASGHGGTAEGCLLNLQKDDPLNN